MGRKMYVGNLSFSIGEDQLIEEFSKYGTIDSIKIIIDHITGRSKGFAFVEMSSDQEASNAIEGLDGLDLDNRKIKVKEATPREPQRGPRSFDRNRY